MHSQRGWLASAQLHFQGLRRSDGNRIRGPDKSLPGIGENRHRNDGKENSILPMVLTAMLSIF
jgi:hypothetical protein